MRPRELWVCLEDESYPAGCVTQNKIFTNQFKVREVVPIDWEKIWQEYAMRGECGIFEDDAKTIEGLVEKQLKGEE